MNFKKFIAILAVSICISNAVHGMEIAKDLIKNEVIPAAAIVVTGAALGAASNVSYNTIDNLYTNRIFNFKKQSLKESLILGAAISLPLLLRARFEFNEPYPAISLSKCAALMGVPFVILTGIFAAANYDEARRVANKNAWYITRTVESIRNTDLNIVRNQLRLIQVVTAGSLFMGYPWLTRSSW